jgi:hypothetical protein
MEHNKYGFPTRKKTMVARFASGGKPGDNKPTYIESVKDRVAELGQKAKAIVTPNAELFGFGEDLTPTLVKPILEIIGKKEPVQEKRAGGRVKARGVGIAIRGHGRVSNG